MSGGLAGGIVWVECQGIVRVNVLSTGGDRLGFCLGECLVRNVQPPRAGLQV